MSTQANTSSAPTRPGRLPWAEARYRLDENLVFNNLRYTPYYRDARYEQFSTTEYARRYAALRAKMREQKLDCVIVPGGLSHWIFSEAAAQKAGLRVPPRGRPTYLSRNTSWQRSMSYRVTCRSGGC